MSKKTREYLFPFTSPPLQRGCGAWCIKSRKNLSCLSQWLRSHGGCSGSQAGYCRPAERHAPLLLERTSCVFKTLFFHLKTLRFSKEKTQPPKKYNNRQSIPKKTLIGPESVIQLLKNKRETNPNTFGTNPVGQPSGLDSRRAEGCGGRAFPGDPQVEGVGVLSGKPWAGV